MSAFHRFLKAHFRLRLFQTTLSDGFLSSEFCLFALKFWLGDNVVSVAHLRPPDKACMDKLKLLGMLDESHAVLSDGPDNLKRAGRPGCLQVLHAVRNGNKRPGAAYTSAAVKQDGWWWGQLRPFLHFHA